MHENHRSFRFVVLCEAAFDTLFVKITHKIALCWTERNIRMWFMGTFMYANVNHFMAGLTNTFWFCTEEIARGNRKGLFNNLWNTIWVELHYIYHEWVWGHSRYSWTEICIQYCMLTASFCSSGRTVWNSDCLQVFNPEHKSHLTISLSLMVRPLTRALRECQPPWQRQIITPIEPGFPFWRVSMVIQITPKTKSLVHHIIAELLENLITIHR